MFMVSAKQPGVTSFKMLHLIPISFSYKPLKFLFVAQGLEGSTYVYSEISTSECFSVLNTYAKSFSLYLRQLQCFVS
jgi:hypothetical protein